MSRLYDINFISNVRDKTVYFLEEYSIFKNIHSLNIIVIFQIFFLLILIGLFYKKEAIFIYKKLVNDYTSLDIFGHNSSPKGLLLNNIKNAKMYCKDDKTKILYKNKEIQAKTLDNKDMKCLVIFNKK